MSRLFIQRFAARRRMAQPPVGAGHHHLMVVMIRRFPLPEMYEKHGTLPDAPPVVEVIGGERYLRFDYPCGCVLLRGEWKGADVDA